MNEAKYRAAEQRYWGGGGVTKTQAYPRPRLGANPGRGADPFGGAAVAREFMPKISRGELELLPGAGHAPWMDDPARAAFATSEFLGGSTEC